MTIFWLIVWVLSHTPRVYMWNEWAIGLAVCLIIDLFVNRNHFSLYSYNFVTTYLYPITSNLYRIKTSSSLYQSSKSIKTFVLSYN